MFLKNRAGIEIFQAIILGCLMIAMCFWFVSRYWDTFQSRGNDVNSAVIAVQGETPENFTSIITP